MTVYKAIKPRGVRSAPKSRSPWPKAKKSRRTKSPKKSTTEADKVPSVLLEPVAVTKDNVKQTVIADEFVTADELCTGAYAKACKEAGIS